MSGRVDSRRSARTAATIESKPASQHPSDRGPTGARTESSLSPMGLERQRPGRGLCEPASAKGQQPLPSADKGSRGGASQPHQLPHHSIAAVSKSPCSFSSACRRLNAMPDSMSGSVSDRPGRSPRARFQERYSELSKARSCSRDTSRRAAMRSFPRFSSSRRRSTGPLDQRRSPLPVAPRRSSSPTLKLRLR